MDTPFFRPEVLQSMNTRCEGAIILARPFSMRIATGAAAALLFALLIFAATGEFTRKVKVAGQLVPPAGFIKIHTPLLGRVISRPVKDGDIVAAGTLLYELVAVRTGTGSGTDARIEATIDIRRARLIQEAAEQKDQIGRRLQSMKEREQLVSDDIAKISQEQSLQQQRIASAAKMRSRYSTLQKKGFVSDLGMAPVENDYINQVSRKHELERARLAGQKELLQIQNDIASAEGESRLAAAQSDRALAMIDQEAAEHDGRSRIQVFATSGGTVTALSADVGQTVSAGTAMATILPMNSELEAHLLVPSRAIGFVSKGQKVLLRLAAFPYQKFGQPQGQVIRVETSPINESSTNANAGQDQVYRVVVRLHRQSVTAYGRRQSFRAGMSFEADICQERKKLIEWVLDPLISAAKGRTD